MTRSLRVATHFRVSPAALFVPALHYLSNPSLPLYSKYLIMAESEDQALEEVRSPICPPFPTLIPLRPSLSPSSPSFHSN